MATMSAVSTMSSMHEHMHQRTSEQEQPRYDSEDVSAMLGKQEHTTHSQESEQNDVAPGRPDIASCGGLVMRMLMVCHRALPFWGSHNTSQAAGGSRMTERRHGGHDD